MDRIEPKIYLNGAYCPGADQFDPNTELNAGSEVQRGLRRLMGYEPSGPTVGHRFARRHRTPKIVEASS